MSRMAGSKTGEAPLTFDFVVIGTGPAGEQAALSAAKQGKRVAIVEKEPRPGGARIHTGTLPSKTLKETAFYLRSLKYRSPFGAPIVVRKDIGIAELMYRKKIVVQEETRLEEARFRRNNVHTFQGHARFEDATTLRVEGAGNPVRLRGEKICIATGSHPARPPGVAFDGKTILDSDSILHIDDVPRSLIVVGGGVIGSEYVSIFSNLGVAVTLIEGRDRPLKFTDRDIADAFFSDLKKRGVSLRVGESVESVREEDGRAVAVLKSGKEISSEKLLFAMGRTGNLEGLDVQKAGLDVLPRGYLKVNEHFQTTQPNIYAVGDVIGFPSLASTSMDQGRHAALHAFAEVPEPTGIDHVLPFGIYTIPEISMCGLTEEQAKLAGLPYAVGVARYFESARGQIHGETAGLLKLVFNREDHRLLGVHIYGERASELLHIGQAVLAFRGNVNYFIENVFNYPTLSELYRIAALNGLNRLGTSES